MTRATRFAAGAAVATLVYLVFALGLVPVPLVPARTAAEILPTVRRC